jgi:2-polyprenyl-6-methoxyphenol hydroxylase-like FAD-dependent oxidoreductase
MPTLVPRLKVAVVGGSIAGLGAGVVLRGMGCDVDVYERTPGAMTSGSGAFSDRALRRAASMPCVALRSRR